MLLIFAANENRYHLIVLHTGLDKEKSIILRFLVPFDFLDLSRMDPIGFKEASALQLALHSTAISKLRLILGSAPEHERGFANNVMQV
jgi:hypothetical protein